MQEHQSLRGWWCAYSTPCVRQNIYIIPLHCKKENTNTVTRYPPCLAHLQNHRAVGLWGISWLPDVCHLSHSAQVGHPHLGKRLWGQLRKSPPAAAVVVRCTVRLGAGVWAACVYRKREMRLGKMSLRLWSSGGDGAQHCWSKGCPLLLFPCYLVEVHPWIISPAR